ncbi:hypothetical protein [Luteolibacter marinus]|uniref:hypothetical protein n=1 Tax=Luteolibacter marinus TaxID=2776705 RepID=UPI00186713E6|nr:hypothetical protein [Luteolibacter marinus]
MNSCIHRTLIAALLALAGLLRAGTADLVVVTGAAGGEEFAATFAKAAAAWQAAGRRGAAEFHGIGADEAGGTDLERLERLVPGLAKSEGGPLWIVLIGHGTFDGREAKFNLRGPDLGAATLKAWLEGARRQVVVVNGSASSAPFLSTLSAPGRVIVTATKNSAEDSYARFGEYLASAIDSPDADRDQDGATSLLEAFLAASAGVKEFYGQQGRIVTEEALIDDNGDGLGTPAGWFRGVRAVKVAKQGAEPDGRRAQQLQLVPGEEERRLDPEARARRDKLEEQLFALRSRKAGMNEDDYFRELERLLREIGAIYAAADDDS